jgi:hypothetical protein
MNTPRQITITLAHALEMHGICGYAAQHYDFAAARYAFGAPLCAYYEKRAECARSHGDRLLAFISRNTNEDLAGASEAAAARDAIHAHPII